MSNDQNVVAFRSRPTTEDLKRVMMGRSRKAALPILIERLRHLYKVATPAQHHGPVTPYHVMSWKRGQWQAELFDEGRSPLAVGA